MFELSNEEITSAPIHRVLTLLSIPLLAQNVVEVASLVIDLFWIGRLGGDAVAAVGLAAPLFSLLLILVIGVPYIGTMILVSQRVGADEQEAAREATFNGVVLGAILSIVIGGGAVVVAPTLVELLTVIRPEPTPAHVVELTVDYFRILALGLVFAATSDVIEAAFVARGDSRAALSISVATVGTILIADPVLIFGLEPIPALGVAGAALASVLGFAAGLVLAVAFVLRGRCGGVMSRAATRVSLDEFRALVDRGLAPSAQQANRRVADLVIVVIVFLAGGPAALAAYAVGTRVFSAASIPAQGFQSATQSVVGQNLGAGKPERAARTARVGVVILGGVLALLAIIQWAMASSITNILAPQLSGESFALAVEFLRLLAVSYPAYGAMYILQGGFNGASRGAVSFRSSLLQYWGLQIPLAGLAATLLGMGVVPVFGAIAVSHVLTAIVLAAYYYTQRDGMFRKAADSVAEASAD
ncbi:MATE family efflux transporter [Natronomonas halophila]|uniref:MATE family efflux transporter n=1 Tax=Natronomonas halophila TaxID=2747817 RepID=UPI0015B3F0A5|nr:MATE family efflux transporter [Natronomonas halophila]QLD84163.1 MATE family efflux transporter [Natronomonas halophila]